MISSSTWTYTPVQYCPFHDCFYSVDSRTPLHFPCAICVFLAVDRVNTAPQWGHSDFAAAPDRSRWCLRRLLNVENSRPLQPWSQHCGFGRDSRTRTWASGSEVTTLLLVWLWLWLRVLRGLWLPLLLITYGGERIGIVILAPAVVGYVWDLCSLFN